MSTSDKMAYLRQEQLSRDKLRVSGGLAIAHVQRGSGIHQQRNVRTCRLPPLS